MATTPTTPIDNADIPTSWGVSVVTSLGEKVLKEGDVMTGALTLPTNPINPLEAATKQYVDTSVSRPPIRRVYTATGANTWTKPANLVAVDVEVQGGGGGSGGAALTAASQVASGAGGGGGGYARKMILAATLGTTETATVGVGGTAGAAGGAGGAGGVSSFGAHATANGGLAGAAGTVLTPPNVIAGSIGGTAASGDINVPGSPSGISVQATAARANRSPGGASVLGPAGQSLIVTTTSAGVAGLTYGGGASGAVNCQSQGTAVAGAIGASGVVIVTEFY